MKKIKGCIEFTIDSKQYVLLVTKSFPKLEGRLLEKYQGSELCKEVPIKVRTYTLKEYGAFYIDGLKRHMRKKRRNKSNKSS